MIAQSILNELAGYIDVRIAKVVINGSYEITNFKVHGIEDNVIALSYIVPVVDLNLISNIELKDANNRVITANNVNIPITADHLMLQTISVKEVK